MALRSSDDLNQLIIDKLAETGSLTSDELFILAKPYYLLTDSKSELSQWARARIANLRKKRKVWPTAHMVYGMSKGKGASGDFEALKDQISPDEFYEAPRTVYWSWDFGLAKHDLERVGRKATSMAPITPKVEPNCDTTTDMELEGGSPDESDLPASDAGAAAAIEDAVATADAAATGPGAPTPKRLTLPGMHAGFQNGDRADDIVSPTRDIRGSLSATHISSPKRGPTYDILWQSPSKRRTPRSSSSDASLVAAAAVVAAAEANEANLFRRDSVNGDSLWDDDEDAQDPMSQSNPESANKLLLLAAAAQLNFPDSDDTTAAEAGAAAASSPPKQLRQGALSAPPTSGSGRSGKRASASPRRGSGQARGSKYKCGKCGFFPKSTPHNCNTRTARAGKGGGSPDRQAASPKAGDSPRYQSRPKQYACGKCGFFPKSTPHSCKTATAIDPASLATSPRRKNYRRTPNPSTPAGEGRPRQYRCGKCGFFPKAMRHDCETGKAYPTTGDGKLPGGKGGRKARQPAAAAAAAATPPAAGGVDLDLLDAVNSEAAAASILSMATSPRRRASSSAL